MNSDLLFDKDVTVIVGSGATFHFNPDDRKCREVLELLQGYYNDEEITNPDYNEKCEQIT